MSTRLDEGVCSASYRTAWGDGRVYVRAGLLVGVDLPGERPARAEREREGGGADVQALSFWVRGLEVYFSKGQAPWSPDEVSLDGLGLAAFERAVYEALLSVPAGETVSYGELAEMAGHPRAARAVGNAMAANPIPIVVPCHRVIRSDGTLGRYGDDPAWKERLLEHERRPAGGAKTGAGQGESAKSGAGPAAQAGPEAS